MGLDLTTALGRLLTDADLRAQFFSNRETTIERLGVAPSAVEVLHQLDQVDFERQASGLIDKRFHRVASMIPMTIRHLGQNSHRWFRDYVESFWPDTHRRHLIDAVEFCRFLQDRQHGLICRSELNLLQFRLSPRFFALHFVSDYYIAGRRRLAIQVLTRAKDNRPVERSYYLRFPALASASPTLMEK